MIKLSLGE